MTDIRDVGDGYPIRYEARDPDTRDLVDATVALTITDPDDATSTPTPTHTSTGVYDYAIPLTAAGRWQYRWDVTGDVGDVAHGEVYARDPAPATYASLAKLKRQMRIPLDDTQDDETLQDRLVAATRRIDDDCGRRFWGDTAVSSRTYRAQHPTMLLVDDIATTTGLVIEVGRGTTWTAVDTADVDALPENCLAELRAIECLERAVGTWPIWGSTRVRITARWGWPVVPEPIENACLLLAARLERRRDSPEGIAGFDNNGPVRVSRYDYDYDNLIHRYVKQVA